MRLIFALLACSRRSVSVRYRLGSCERNRRDISDFAGMANHAAFRHKFAAAYAGIGFLWNLYFFCHFSSLRFWDGSLPEEQAAVLSFFICQIGNQKAQMPSPLGKVARRKP